MPAPYQLPAAVSREVVLPAAGGLLIAGGLSLGGQILVAGGSRTVYRFDPATHRIVWQYGHTARAGRGAGYLSDPDGVDLVPPDSLLITHAATMGQP